MKLSLNDLDSAPTTRRGLPSISSSDAAVEIDWKKRHDEVSSELTEVKQEFDTYQRRNRADDILNTLIEPYSKRIFYFMVAYCVFVGTFLSLTSLGCFSNPVSDSVLNLLVGSTATTVLGLVGMVLAGIFSGARKKF